MIKRLIISVISTLIMLCAAITVSAEEALYIDFDAETGTIKNVYNPPKDVYEIPSEIDGVTVRKLVVDSGYENELNHVKTIIIPETIEEIKWYSYECETEKVIVKEGNPYLREYEGVMYSKDMKTLITALRNLSGEYIIPDGVETIKTDAFVLQFDLETIKLPSSVSTIEEDAFSYYHGNIIIDDSNPYFKMIDAVLYTADMKELVLCLDTKQGSFTIPESVEKIRAYAFHDTSLSEIILHENIREIAAGAFYHSNATNGIRIPDGITEIKNDTFSFAKSEWIILPDSVVSLGQDSLDVYGTDVIYIPASVTDISERALGYLHFKLDAPPVIYTPSDSAMHKFALENDLDVELTDGMTTDEIETLFRKNAVEPEYHFYPESTGNITGIENIHTKVLEIPASIGELAITSVYLDDFRTVDDEPIEKLIIPDSVKIKAYSSFVDYEIEISENNEYMTVVDGVVYSKDMKTLIYCIDDINGEFTVPESVETINDFAFAGHKMITKLNLPKNLYTIEATSIVNVNIHEISINENNKYFTVVDNILFSKDMDTLVACPSPKSGAYTIPDSVETIYPYAFVNSALSEIILPDSITTIGHGAFAYCLKLEKIVLPESITEIPDMAFYHSPLKEITIPDTVTEIGEDAFAYTDLSEINIPASVTNIDDRAFGHSRSPIIFAEYGSAAHEYAIVFLHPCIVSGKPMIIMHIGYEIMNAGNEQITLDVPPQIINDRTMVPLRAIFEAIGADVQWDDATRTITAIKDGTTITMQIDNPAMIVNGTEISLDAPPQIKNDRTLVPVRAISESFGCDVEWNNATRTVIITVK